MLLFKLLDPSFQGLSTLTEKGTDYCRKTGPGIAMIEFTLINGNGESADDLCFAEEASTVSSISEVPLDGLRMQRFSGIPMNTDVGSIYIRIKITGTALNREILHEWIFLTLNQSLIGWIMERICERSFYGLPRPMKEHGVDDIEMKQKRLVDDLCPGLPAIKSIFESSYDLPHSAIARFDSSGVIRSSSVATLTLDLLENCILAPLVERKMLSLIGDDTLNAPKRVLLEKIKSNIKIIRISRAGKPRIVHLKWNIQGHKKAVVSDLSRTVEDSPIDCPEYICFYALSERDHNIKCIYNQLRLYREIMIHDGISEKSESIELLESVKEKKAEAFMRSFAFLLSVKRNARRLWMYNWNPKLVKK